MSKQFATFEKISNQNKGLELQVRCPLLLNIHNQESIPQINKNLGESKNLQLSSEIQQQSESTIVEEDIHQTDEIKTSPLSSMHFDRSCTKTNAGASVWICNTENNHIESISCRLNF